jgi:hypothetical protein
MMKLQLSPILVMAALLAVGCSARVESGGGQLGCPLLRLAIEIGLCLTAKLNAGKHEKEP